MATGVTGAFANAIGGSAIGNAVVRLALDTRGYDASLNKARGETVAGTSAMGKSTSTFSKVAQASFLIAGIAAIKFAADSIKSYEDHEKALLLLQNALDNSPAIINKSTKAYEEQATSLQNLTGYQDEEVLKADAVLAKFGLTEDQLLTLNPLVLDYARVTGVDAVTAAGNLGKALLGNTRALKTIGVQYTATGDRTADVTTLTAALEGKVGGVAVAYGQTLPGQLDIANAKFDDVKEVLGQQLIPVMTDLLDLLVTLMPVITLAAQTIGAFASAIDAVIDPIGAANAAQDDYNAKLQEYLDIVEKKFGPTMAAFVAAQTDASNFLTYVFTPALAQQSEALDNATNASNTWIGSVNIAAGQALPAATVATQGYTAAIHESLDAVLASTDATFAIIDAFAQDAQAANDLAAAQHHLNELTDKGTTSGHQYEEAQQAVTDASLASTKAHASLLAKVQDLTAAYDDGTTTRKQAIQDLKDMADSAGLTKEQTKLLTDELRNGIDALKTWNATPMVDKQATLTLFGITTGIPIGGNAAGGIIGAASGMVTRSPTLLVGEGGYSTPFGRGSEAILPLNDATMSRLGAEIGKHISGGGSGDINIYNAGSVVTPNQLVDDIHEGLVRKGRRGGALQLT